MNKLLLIFSIFIFISIINSKVVFGIDFKGREMTKSASSSKAATSSQEHASKQSESKNSGDMTANNNKKANENSKGDGKSTGKETDSKPEYIVPENADLIILAPFSYKIAPYLDKYSKGEDIRLTNLNALLLFYSSRYIKLGFQSGYQKIYNYSDANTNETISSIPIYGIIDFYSHGKNFEFMLGFGPNVIRFETEIYNKYSLIKGTRYGIMAGILYTVPLISKLGLVFGIQFHVPNAMNKDDGEQVAMYFQFGSGIKFTF